MSWFSWNCEKMKLFQTCTKPQFFKRINIFVFHKFESEQKSNFHKPSLYGPPSPPSKGITEHLFNIFVYEYLANNSTLPFLRYQEHYDNNCEACCEINFWSHHSWSFRRQIHQWIERCNQCQNQGWRTCKEVSWSRTTKMQIESNPILHGNNCIFWNVQWGHCWQSKFFEFVEEK